MSTQGQRQSACRASTQARVCLRFFLPGLPAPAGSHRAFPLRRKDGSLGVAVAPDSRRLRDWVNLVRLKAAQCWRHPPLRGAVCIRLRFLLPRPKAHYRTGRHQGQIKASAPRWPVKRPDVDKLARAVLDGLTGVVVADDAQVVRLDLVKRFADVRSGVHVRVACLDGDEA